MTFLVKNMPKSRIFHNFGCLIKLDEDSTKIDTGM